MDNRQKNYLFTSESVSAGHPDKVADQISDAILDAYLQADPNSHVACETLVTRNMVVLAGETKSSKTVSVGSIVRRVLREIGYTRQGIGFAAEDVVIINQLHKQSNDIDNGVRQGQTDQGAGDQGMMFGYATRETPGFIPVGLYVANAILKQMDEDRRVSGRGADYLMPDAKSQVTVRYENGQPAAIDTVVVSTMHTEFDTDEAMQATVSAYVLERLMPKVIARLPEGIRDLFSSDTKYHINPSGRFVEGGPAADTGLTGRKIIVDTYGGKGAHGGGAFSGKDPSKVDRSAAYMARYIAKNLVAAGVADEMLVQVSYAIGVAHPVSVMVETYGTSHGLSDEEIADLILYGYDLTPGGIERKLDLRHTHYQETAAYGHFGRESGSSVKNGRYVRLFPWEEIDEKETTSIIKAYGPPAGCE